MATLNIFVSFEFDKDNDLKESFYTQAKEHSKRRVRNRSLNERHPSEAWKNKASEAIKGCDVVVVLIGQDTHNAPGVIAETDMARTLKKPVIQIRPKRRTYTGLARLDEPIPWKWKTINARLNEISPRKR